jgi:hypothetical protein
MVTSLQKIESVAEWISLLQTFEQQHIAQWFYRGHSDSRFQLTPSLFRLNAENSAATPDEVEEYVMNIFKAEAKPHLQFEPADDLEWLALAQHHGLPTRLLDWSVNPLVALFFAAEAQNGLDAEVWCLGFPSTNNCQPKSTHLARRLTLAKCGFIHFPKHISPRMTNQTGCFTVHTSNVPLDQDKNYENFLDFTRVQIKASAKSQIINELYNLGIHRGFIYPGLDGLASRIVYEVTIEHLRPTTDHYSVP